jgi:hypothetical protein
LTADENHLGFTAIKPYVETLFDPAEYMAVLFRLLRVVAVAPKTPEVRML